MALENITGTSNIAGNPREIDFVTRFADNWQGLLNIMGVSNMVEQTPGTDLRVKKGGVVLASSPAEGELVPLSQASVTDASIGTITLKKHKKEVTAEAIQKFGFDVAVAKTDKAFENSLRGEVMSAFYAFLSTGTLSCSASGFQATLSLAIGNVINAFSTLNLDITGVVAFVNINDFFTYLGGASISVQKEFGYTYIKNFLGCDVMFLCNDNQVAQGKIYTTAIENIICYYINPANADFNRAELNYTVDAVAPIIGVHVRGDYDYVGTIMDAVYGMVMACEYLSGICVGTINA